MAFARPLLVRRLADLPDHVSCGALSAAFGGEEPALVLSKQDGCGTPTDSTGFLPSVLLYHGRKPLWLSDVGR